MNAEKKDSKGTRKSQSVAAVGLYEKHKTIYARSVKGVFENWRWGMVLFTQAVFYGLCWLDWGGRQAVLGKGLIRGRRAAPGAAAA